ncbi:helix-turn-helix protein [compost metagenome]
MRKASEISTILKERRSELGWNQKDFLMKIGMTQQQYQRIESGSDIRVSTLLRILAVMDLECVIVPKKKERDADRLLQQPADYIAKSDKSSDFEQRLKDLED